MGQPQSYYENDVWLCRTVAISASKVYHLPFGGFPSVLGTHSNPGGMTRSVEFRLDVRSSRQHGRSVAAAAAEWLAWMSRLSTSTDVHRWHPIRHGDLNNQPDDNHCQQVGLLMAL